MAIAVVVVGGLMAAFGEDWVKIWGILFILLALIGKGISYILI